ncbi:MAG: DUF2815 family protein [Bacteroidales bacterium]|nr:DUF2815 family protein [Bacteroidales bacterium]
MGTTTSKKVVTPTFRASFVNVFEPRQNEQSGKLEYSVKMIFDKDADLTGLKEIIKEAIRNKWGNNPPKNLKMPLRNGNESDLDKYPEDADKVIANAKSVAYPPGLIDAKTKQEILDPKEFYSGCYARASLVAYAYDNVSKGVAFGLQNLLKIRDGEPLVNRASAESDFAGIIDSVQNEVGEDTTSENDDILGDLND